MFPKPLDEEHRLDALYSLAVLDTAPEPAFDRITRCVSRIFQVPIAIVSLLDRDRQWFKSCIGLDANETPRDMAFCAHAIMRDDVMCVPDTAADPRFRENPLVVGPPHIGFYAGAPLVTTDGFRLGTLCVIDTKARPMLSTDDKSLLRDFAAMVVEKLEYRRNPGTTDSDEGAKTIELNRQAALRADAAKDEFLAMMSHELRTPLNAIMGFSDILARESFGPIGNQRYRDYAQTIHESGEHLLTMIDTILDFSSAARGEIVPKEIETDLQDVAEQCIRLLAEKARRFRVEVTGTRIDGIPSVYADRKHVLQMLLNVVGNAIKFNRPGGVVVLMTGLDAAGAVHIAVTDTGIGIPSSLIDRLSAPFAQIDGRLARQYEGIGLGLAITRRLLELHGGALSLQSQVGEGTSVVLSFPAYRTVGAEPTTVTSASAG